MEGFQLSECRFLSDIYYVSAADALFVESAQVPNNRVWAVLQSCMFPGVAETRTVWASVMTASGNTYPLFAPVSALLNNTGRFFPVLEQGFQLYLFPGDRLRAYRDAATAGSVMYVSLRFADLDLPLYDYVEPQRQRRLRKAAQSIIEPIGRRGGRGLGGGVSVGGWPVGGEPGRGLEK